MKTEEIKLSINSGLSRPMERAGFKYKKTTFDYVRRLHDSSHIYRIFLHAKSGWFLVEPAVFIGSSEVNKIFNQALRHNHPVNDWTCGFGVRNKFRERGNYPINSPADMSGVVAALECDFLEIALPAFEHYGGILGIDVFLNKRGNEGRYKPDSVDAACRGLIAAKLGKNKDFEVIFEDYYEFCRTNQGMKLAEPIRTVRNFMMNM